MNVHNNTKADPAKGGMLYDYYLIAGGGGNMYPTTWPTRCQACGAKTVMENGTWGEFPCFPKGSGEDWFKPGDITKHPELVTSHQNGFRNYSMTHKYQGRNGIPYWWVKNMTAPSRCPRGIDCPDWRYKGEEPY